MEIKRAAGAEKIESNTNRDPPNTICRKPNTNPFPQIQIQIIQIQIHLVQIQLQQTDPTRQYQYSQVELVM